MRIYATDLTEAQWALVDSIIPEGKPGGRPRSIDVRAVVNAIFYLLRTGCQWRLLPREFPPWPDAHKRIRGRKRHILVDTLGIPIANRVEAANMSDRRAAAGLLGGLGPIFPTITTIIADAGHQSRKLTRLIKAEGYELRIVKSRKRMFEKSQADARRLRIRRVAAMSISVSEVCTLYS